jgi:hypothetical protein
MLLLAGRGDLVVDGLSTLRGAADEVGASLALTLYTGSFVDDTVLAAIWDLVDGVMAPVNTIGAAMLPDREIALDWLASTGKPVIAMHVLAGATTILSALRFALNCEQVAAVVVGASSPEHQEELAAAARELFLEGGV